MEDMTDITIASYDATAKQYHEKTNGISMNDSIQRLTSHLSKGDSILDLGCGTGRDVNTLMNMGYMVTGIDLSSEMLREAEKNFPEGYFILGDMRSLPFPNNSFDGIWACASIIHVPRNDLEKTLKEARRVLTDRGMSSFHLKQGDGEELLEDSRYGGVKKGFTYYRRPEIESALEKSGFEVIDFHGTEIGANDYQTHPWLEFIAQKR